MITTTIIERRFSGDGMTASFPVDIEGIPDAPGGAGHLALSVMDAGGETETLAYGVDFSYAAVVVNGFSKSVVVTLAAPLPVGDILVVRRTTPITSISSYPDDKTPPRQVERDFDNVVKIMQEVDAKTESMADMIPSIADDLALKADKTELRALETVVAGKASKDPATPSAPGLMSPADKAKLDGVGVATTSRVGLVKPDGVSVTVDADGTVHAAGGGGGTSDHRALSYRDAPGQHPASAVDYILPDSSTKPVQDALSAFAAGLDAKAPKDNPAFTGDVVINGDAVTELATAVIPAGDGSYVIAKDGQDVSIKALAVSDIANLGFALLDSPDFTGTPTAPTPDADDDSDRIATTAQVQSALAAAIGGGAGAAPLPNTGGDVGRWIALLSASPSVSLPAGGTWAYFVVCSLGPSALGVDTRSFLAGVAAGGTVISTMGGSGTRSGGFAWRIT